MSDQQDQEIKQEQQVAIEKQQDQKSVDQYVPRAVQKEKQSNLITVDRGLITPSNHSELIRVISQLAKGGAFPERFDTLEKQLAVYNMAYALMKDRWQIALPHLAYVKGVLCMFGEFPGALAELTNEVERKNLYCINKNYEKICPENKNIFDDPIAGVCELKRTGRTLNQYYFSIKDAETANLFPAKKRDGSIAYESPWMKYTKTMLMRKALGQGIKFEFPDAILGTPLAEYDYNSAPDLDGSINSRRVKSVVDVASTLNEVHS